MARRDLPLSSLHVSSPQSSAARSPEAGSWLKREGAELKEAATRWADDACYRMGASLAYYAIFSIFPLLLLAVTALGFFLGADPANREKLLGAVANVVSPQFRSLLDDTLSSMQSHETARGVGAIVGVVTLLFGASGVFAELETSLNTIWRVKDDASSSTLATTVLRALKDKAISLASVLAAGALLLLSLLVSTALAALSGVLGRNAPEALVWQCVEAVVSLALSAGLFAVLFRVVPKTRVAWGDVLGGAFLTAALFSVLKHLLAWYLGHLGSYAAYGAVGAVLGLLTWIYLASLLVFFGAELARVHAEREGSLAHGSVSRAAQVHP